MLRVREDTQNDVLNARAIEEYTPSAPLHNHEIGIEIDSRVALSVTVRSVQVLASEDLNAKSRHRLFARKRPHVTTARPFARRKSSPK